MEGTSQFCGCIGLIAVRNIVRAVNRHSGDKCSPSGLGLGGIPEGYSGCTPGGIRGKQVLMVRSWTSVRDAIRSAPGASPPRLGGRTGRDECDTCVIKGQT